MSVHVHTGSKRKLHLASVALTMLVPALRQGSSLQRQHGGESAVPGLSSNMAARKMGFPSEPEVAPLGKLGPALGKLIL